MSSTGVNVLRWSALGMGVFYGFYHQRTIRATQRAEVEKREFQEKQKLIERAKSEYANKISAKTSSGDGVVTDVQDAKFDLEKYLLKLARENP